MPVSRTIAALVLTASFVVTACSATGAVGIGTASSQSLGTFLTGANGKTLYAHAGDGTTHVTSDGLPLYYGQGEGQPGY
jgi:predicted lipoprotein with Yx(FWY)xxD motif